MEGLGIQPTQLIMQAINFAILVIVLAKFLYKPLLRAIEERQQKIREGLELREKAKEEMEKIEILKEKKIDEGRKEAKDIIKEAKDEARKQAQTILEEAQAQSLEEMKKAEKEIENQKRSLMGTLEKETVNLAVSMTEKILKDILSDDAKQRELIEKRIEQLSHIKHEAK